MSSTQVLEHPGLFDLLSLGQLDQIESEINITHESPTYAEKLHKQIQRIAATDLSVIILGETGTGKEIAAHAIHQASIRASKPFIVVNCTMLSPELLQAELFGHEKGAFTNAIAQRKGLLEEAEGGTVFFDEIGELPLVLQAKLLRFLQEKTIQRVGSNREILLDVRILSATNQDLEALMAKKLFRQDLFYRLKQLQLTIAPLRQRKEDIKNLALLFLKEASPNRSRSLSKDALCFLEQHSWPGNIREFKSVIAAAAALTDSSILRLADIEAHISYINAEPAESIDMGSCINLRHPNEARFLSLDEVERRYLILMMKTYNGNKQCVAEQMGIYRPRLYNLLKKHKLT